MNGEAEAYATWQAEQAADRWRAEVDGAGRINESMGREIERWKARAKVAEDALEEIAERPDGELTTDDMRSVARDALAASRPVEETP